MLVPDEFLRKLRGIFDLNIYEVKIWIALLSKGIATAGELSDISSVPRSRSYDVLESLEKKGFIVMKLDKPIKYIAVEPKEIISRVKRGVSQRAEEQVSALENVRGTEVYNELELLHKQGIENVDPANVSGSLKGRTNVYDHLHTLFGNAEKDILVVTSNTGLIRKADIFKKQFKKLKTKGIKIKIVAPLTKENESAFKELKEVAEVKNVDKVNARFSIIDGKQIVFMVNDDAEVHENYDVGIWASTPYFAKAMNEMFESNWTKMEA